MQLMNEVIFGTLWPHIECLEKDYQKFMESELCEWTNLMLSLGVLQSLSVIRKDNPPAYQQLKSKSSGNSIIVQAPEGQKYYDLQRRYMTIYIQVYDKLRQRPFSQNFIDSEYEEDDEEMNSELRGLFRKDEIDSDDEDCSYRDADDDEGLYDCYSSQSQPCAPNFSDPDQFLFSNINPTLLQQIKECGGSNNPLMNLSNFLHGTHDCDDEDCSCSDQLNSDGFGKGFGPLPTFNFIPDHLCNP